MGFLNLQKSGNIFLSLGLPMNKDGERELMVELVKELMMSSLSPSDHRKKTEVFEEYITSDAIKKRGFDLTNPGHLIILGLVFSQALQVQKDMIGKINTSIPSSQPLTSGESNKRAMRSEEVYIPKLKES